MRLRNDRLHSTIHRRDDRRAAAVAHAAEEIVGVRNADPALTVRPGALIDLEERVEDGGHEDGSTLVRLECGSIQRRVGLLVACRSQRLAETGRPGRRNAGGSPRCRRSPRGRRTRRRWTARGNSDGGGRDSRASFARPTARPARPRRPRRAAGTGPWRASSAPAPPAASPSRRGRRPALPTCPTSRPPSPGSTRCPPR